MIEDKRQSSSVKKNISSQLFSTHTKTKTDVKKNKERKLHGRLRTNHRNRIFLRRYVERKGFICTLKRFLDYTLQNCCSIRRLRSSPISSIQATRSSPEQFYISPDTTHAKQHAALYDNHRLCSIEETTSWLYLSSFGRVLVTFAILYISFVTTFALFIFLLNLYYVNQVQRECMDGWVDDVPGYVNFEATFSLSWTTFSTVGYGHVSPNKEYYNCVGLELICALEAFFGLLYLAFCGSIIFAKIVLLHSKARVSFSSIMCLEFKSPSFSSVAELSKGCSLVSSTHEENNRRVQEYGSKGSDYPFLEFRVVNDDANNPKRAAIVDASIKCVLVSYHTHQRKEDNSSSSTSSSNGLEEHNHSQVVESSQQSEFNRDLLQVINSERKPITKRHFNCLHVEPNTHPFFVRVWYVRHRLDVDSPILKPVVKEAMIANEGRWPSELNDYDSIRDALLPFCHIIVTFSGTSMVTMEQVFAFTSYSFDDIYIGWQFAPIFHTLPTSENEAQDRGESETTTQSQIMDESCFFVDKSFIHDIVPQEGGGNEPIGD